MASIINASATGVGGVITTADASGVLDLQSNGTTIATINSTGLSMASGKVLAQSGVPAFNAYSSSTLSLSNSVVTKAPVNVEEFDTNNCYDTTLYRFTPNVAGYYNVFGVGGFYPSGATTAAYVVYIYKNGSSFYAMTFASSNGPAVYANINQLIYLNGSTDYVELYLFQNTGATRSVEGIKFQASLARAA